MHKTITLRLSEAAYEAVKRHADAEDRSMNAWIEDVLNVEDMRRRAAAHESWLARNPAAVAFSQAWADRAFDELMER